MLLNRDVPHAVGLSHEFEAHPGCFDEFSERAELMIAAAEFVKVALPYFGSSILRAKFNVHIRRRNWRVS